MPNELEYEMSLLRDGYMESLCPDSEAYMERALSLGTYALLNDTFLVKNYGYVVGLAMPGSTFDDCELNTRQWYSLNGHPNLKSVIRRWTDDGEPKRIIVPGLTRITPNRGVKEVYRGKRIQMLFDQVYEAAAALMEVEPTYFDPPIPDPPA